MKPKPFSALNHLTVPCAMRGNSYCLDPKCGYVVAGHLARRAGGASRRPGLGISQGARVIADRDSRPPTALERWFLCSTATVTVARGLLGRGEILTA
jgi:hypothetical protein